MGSNVTGLTFGFAFRSLFYFVNPDEAEFAKISDVPRYVEQAVPLMQIGIIVEFLISLYKKEDVLHINDSVISLTCGNMQQLAKFAIGTGELLIYSWVYENYRLVDLPWQSPSTWIFCLFGVDCCYYWFHRALHEINFLWAFHQPHHSSEYYNTTTALRQGMLQFNFQWIFYSPLALAIPPSIFFVHLQLNLIYQFWIHTQFVRSLGPLDLFLNTPSHHRVHHGRNPYCLDKNYGGALIIWDRLFGTFQEELEEEKVVYGLVQPVNSFNIFYVQFFYLKNIWDKFWAMKGLQNKLCSLIKGPAWSPGTPWCGNASDIPKIELPVIKHDPVVSTERKIYVLVHVFLLYLVFNAMLDKMAAQSFQHNFCQLLVFFFSYIIFGTILEAKWYSAALESLRCVIVVCTDALLTTQKQRIPGVPNEYLNAFRSIFCFSGIAWIILAGNDFSKMRRNMEKRKE